MPKTTSLDLVRLTSLLAGAFAFAACFTKLEHPAPADGDISNTDVVVPDVAPGETPKSDAAPDLPLTASGGTTGSDAPGELRPVDSGAAGGIAGGGGTGGITGSGGGGGVIVGSGGIVTASGGLTGSGGGGGSTTLDAPVDQATAGTVGAACTTSSDCALGNCANGVCCATPCTGCNACAAALTGKADGTCAAAKTGLDPNSFCADERATVPCGNDGTCDGTGACRKAGNTQPCKDPTCSGSVFTPASTCNGSGSCVASTPQECAPFQCALTGCLKTCSTNADCGATSYCKISSGTTGTCTTKNPNGTPATQTYECVSGVVADGVCCDKACTGCNACSGAPLTGAPAGTCSFVLDGQVAHSACVSSGVVCGLDGKCDGAGACRSTPKAGQSCDDPANKCVTGRVCQSGTCTAGTPKTCPASTLQCRSAGTCDPATGSCNYPWAPDGASCTDNNSCTNDVCQGGSCVSSQILCNNPPACKLSTTCSGGTCSYTQNASDGVADPKCPGNTPYCYSGTCVRCASDAQCGAPTPSCDPVTHTCVCRRPSPSNLLMNPGFNGSLSNWTPNGTAVYSSIDADGCAGSGSVYVENGENDPWQCFPVTAGRLYRLGLRSRGGVSGGFVRINMFTGANCTGTLIENYDGLRFSDPADTTAWLPYDNYSFTPPAGTVSAKLNFFSMIQWIDQVYVNPDGPWF